MKYLSDYFKDNSKTHIEMANAIRALSIAAVEKAKSGHPGIAMGAADILTVLFSKFLKFNVNKPNWEDRDRFILSAGHGSSALYSLIHLVGYPEMEIEDIKNFRQLHSKTPGHPEKNHDLGIEMTTGPLGQGIAHSVGFALGERVLNNRFGDDLVNHRTFVLASDGDLMEGISQEAISLAGHLKLGRLIVLYDDNKISIDGSTDLSFSEDVPGRFEASGWHVVRDADGHNAAAIEDALNEAIAVTDKPSLIAFRTVIGFGSPNKGGTSESHGAPLGADEVMKSMEKLGVDYAPFKVFDEALKLWREAGVRGNGEYTAWKKRHDAHEKALEFDEAMRADVTEGAKAELYEKAMEELKLSFAKAKPNQATRKASGSVIEAIFPAVRELIGGSADLSGSNNTMPKGCGVIEPGKYYARYIHYGVREHAMFAIMGGLSLHGGFIPYGGAFFVFVDYGRPSVRLSALMGIRVIYVMTHDSIGVGEDGRTHQPIEQLAVMRAIPNLIVGRVCDGIETAELWDIALKNKHRPTMLCLTRQNLPTIRDYQGGRVNLSAKGAYIIKGEGETRDITLLATGSEVKLALDAREKLQMDGINAVVVSMPSLELFEEQSEEYKKSVLGTAPRIAVEAGIRMCWDRYIGENGAFIGMEGFGESAPAEVLFEHFDITADRIVREAMRILNGVKR